MVSVGRTTMGNVKRRRDGSMKKRWMAAGALEAKRSFRRVKGCQAMPVLVDRSGRRPASRPPGTMRRRPEESGITAGLQQRPGHPLDRTVHRIKRIKAVGSPVRQVEVGRWTLRTSI
jgi:hypothetical protein